jgi:hypothetical protein
LELSFYSFVDLKRRILIVTWRKTHSGMQYRSLLIASSVLPAYVTWKPIVIASMIIGILARLSYYSGSVVYVQLYGVFSSFWPVAQYVLLMQSKMHKKEDFRAWKMITIMKDIIMILIIMILIMTIIIIDHSKKDEKDKSLYKYMCIFLIFFEILNSLLF